MLTLSAAPDFAKARSGSGDHWRGPHPRDGGRLWAQYNRKGKFGWGRD
jgi:hypothetical protein